MKRSGIVVVVVVVAWVLAAGDACPGVPSMAPDAACHEASTSPAMYDLCVRMLYFSPPTSEVTVYAVVAARAAAQSCGATTDAGEQMSQNGSLSGALKDAWDGCSEEYGTARDAMADVGDQLGRCEFGDMRQQYTDAVAAIEDCTGKLLPVGGTSTPLYAMVLADRDRAVLAFRLGLLLIR